MAAGRAPSSPEGLFSLTGRTALVTGARTGIGRAIALGLAAAGADLVLHGRDDDLGEVEAEVRRTGRRVSRWVLDLSEPGRIPEAAARLDPVDVLVNNAGIIHRAPAAEHRYADFRRVLDVDLDAVWLLSQAVGARMLERGSGKIIMIASMLSFQGGINVPGYTAAKHAVAGLTRALACEWAARGVQVNAIAPGYIATANTERLRADPVREAEIAGRIPAGRWGEPDDLVGAAVFLASRASDYVNGHVLAVDGGWLAR
ncbi:2-dehydro-3-deoxy-D-gluconate 5-dehydrogenase KduD [Planomonospora alba]|uniref:2-dehydro-3-deoxy-D-gluconate 5-dehydrogenase KduD n=1 Tax=Planomonospora alba TaxID=161354 RepID=A0ABP6MVV6_9ACTN